jgi:amino acid adenylation domain-containing protein
MTDTAVADSYSLSPLQHGTLLHYLRSGRSTGADIVQLEATLPEPVAAETLARAWELVTARHAILRTRFRWEGVDTPQQEVLSRVAAPFVEHDLSDLSPADRSAAIEQFLRDDRRRGIDLGTAPLWRVTLFRLGDGSCRMIWTYSQAILDGCDAELLRECYHAYSALGAGASPRLVERRPYRDHIQWLQRDWSSRADSARQFWRERLAGFTTPSTLDALRRSDDEGGPAEIGQHTLRFRLRPSTSDALRRLGAEHGFHVSVFVEAAWALVVSAFSGKHDVVFGVIRPCRGSSVPDAESILGLLLNIVPIRATVSGDRPLLSLLRELRDGQVAIRSYEHTPLVETMRCADAPRATPLFDTIVAFHDQDEESRFKHFGGFADRGVVVHDQPPGPFTVVAYDGASISFKLAFDRNRFTTAAGERVANLLERILDGIAARPGVTLAELPRLPEKDEATLARFNQTAVAIPLPACVHQAVEAQVDRIPDAVAVVFRDQSLTYRELDERANRIAAELVAAGIGPEALVAIFVDRSLEMVIGLLGILKAGGAYVPLDPSYPPERNALFVAETRASVVLTVDRLRPAVPPSNATILTIDGCAAGKQSRCGAPVRPDQLAYVMFTSGSTGRPKGVQIEHRNVANFFGGMDAVLGTTPGVWLALTSISFDPSLLEIFWTLARGFTVVVQDAIDRTVRDLRGQIRRHGVTHMQCTPSFLARLAIADDGLHAVEGLRHLLVGGEALPPPLVDQLRPHLTGTLYNMYGPTETTIWSSAAIVTPGRAITIGRPIANTTIHILDHTLAPVPIGVTGELVVGGSGVARGYFARPELDAERFVHDPVTGERRYRTGDLAAWRQDGTVAWLGRMDTQVKIRGYRVELGEVESVIAEHPSVRECVAVIRKDAAGDVRLIAYVVARPTGDRPAADDQPGLRTGGNQTRDLRRHAQDRLPWFMVPNVIVLLDAMPLTPMGKVDRNALPAVQPAVAAASRPAPPIDERERVILAVVQGLVGSPVGVDDAFPDVGVDSLLMLQAGIRLQARLGHPVPLEQLFKHPTARRLAAALRATEADAVAVREGQRRAEQRCNAMQRRQASRWMR